MVLCWFCLYAACRKDLTSPESTDEIVSPVVGTRFEFTLDSIFLYAKQVYLWGDMLPEYAVFNPRGRYGNISPDLVAYKAELFDISQVKINPASGSPFEFPVYEGNPKYSYLAERSAGSKRVAEKPQISTHVVLHSTNLLSNDKNIGYVALGAFSELSSCRDELDQAFSRIGLANPETIIVDIRYNSGGYIESAEYVANLIAPSDLNGKVMYSEQFNAQMQTKKAAILRHQPYLNDQGEQVIYQGRNATMADVNYSEAGNTYHFSKKGNLETVKNVCFIVSGNTASASELLISCLKPYFNVTLVGEKTYGKPVGFFGINIDKYSVYLASFLIRNAEGWSDYLDGMTPDLLVKSTGIPVFGDPNELCLSKALELINAEGLVKTIPKLSNRVVIQANPEMTGEVHAASGFIPMIENRLKLKH